LILGHKKAKTTRTYYISLILGTDKPSGQIREKNTNKEYLSVKWEKTGFWSAVEQLLSLVSTEANVIPVLVPLTHCIHKSFSRNQQEEMMIKIWVP